VRLARHTTRLASASPLDDFEPGCRPDGITADPDGGRVTSTWRFVSGRSAATSARPAVRELWRSQLRYKALLGSRPTLREARPPGRSGSDLPGPVGDLPDRAVAAHRSATRPAGPARARNLSEELPTVYREIGELLAARRHRARARADRGRRGNADSGRTQQPAPQVAARRHQTNALLYGPATGRYINGLTLARWQVPARRPTFSATAVRLWKCRSGCCGDGHAQSLARPSEHA
jgi:hypothetical protein